MRRPVVPPVPRRDLIVIQPHRVPVIDNGGWANWASVLSRCPATSAPVGRESRPKEWSSTREPFVVVASHDLIVEPTTFGELLTVVERDRTIGIVGPMVPHLTSRFDSESLDEFVEVPFVSGTCMLLRRECVQQVGMFDELFGSYVEDVDYLYPGPRRWLASRCRHGRTSSRTGLGGSSPPADGVNQKSIRSCYTLSGANG